MEKSERMKRIEAAIENAHTRAEFRLLYRAYWKEYFRIKEEGPAMDEVTKVRMHMTRQLNSEEAGRVTLEEKYGKVWDTEQLLEEFDVKGFAAPFVVVTRKSDGQRGSLMFQNQPRFYFGFEEA